MTWTYKLLPDLPLPAQHILDQIDLEQIPSDPNMGYTGQRLLENWRGCNGPAWRNMCQQPPWAFIDWVEKNICKDYLNASIMYCHGQAGITSTGAHTDKGRDIVLICNLLTGGPATELCFWREKNQDLIRQDVLALGTLNDLDLIDSVRIAPMTWYMVNSRILHSVENLQSARINLQVSFVDLPDRLQSLINV